MAQEELDPLDLMSGVAILVLEARTPDPSVKGRVEGPHCPIPRPGGHHMCSKETLEVGQLVFLDSSVKGITVLSYVS